MCGYGSRQTICLYVYIVVAYNTRHTVLTISTPNSIYLYSNSIQQYNLKLCVNCRTNEEMKRISPTNCLQWSNFDPLLLHWPHCQKRGSKLYPHTFFWRWKCGGPAIAKRGSDPPNPPGKSHTDTS